MKARTLESKRRCRSCGFGLRRTNSDIVPTGPDTICTTCRRHQSRMFPADTAAGIDADSGQPNASIPSTSAHRKKEGRA